MERENKGVKRVARELSTMTREDLWQVEQKMRKRLCKLDMPVLQQNLRELFANLFPYKEVDHKWKGDLHIFGFHIAPIDFVGFFELIDRARKVEDSFLKIVAKFIDDQSPSFVDDVDVAYYYTILDKENNEVYSLETTQNPAIITISDDFVARPLTDFLSEEFTHKFEIVTWK